MWLRNVFAAVAVLLCAGLQPCIAAAGQPVSASSLYLKPNYDETADPAADVRAAVAAAKGRNILVEVGGDWCVWCKILDLYLANNADVRAEFAKSFLIVRVYFDPDGSVNSKFVANYPEVTGYPGFIILDSAGKFRAVQDTGHLERGKSYDKAKMIAFAKRWRN